MSPERDSTVASSELEEEGGQDTWACPCLAFLGELVMIASHRFVYMAIVAGVSILRYSGY